LLKEIPNCLAIVPARGGSKGIPRKNVRLVAGKPLIGYTIEAALQSKLVNRVVVSTEDPEIAQVAERFGAEVVWRPMELSSDTAPSEQALLHTLEYLRKTEGYEPDLIVFLQCTSPLILPQDIDGTIQTLLDEDADSALAVAPFYHFLWKRDKAGNAVGINHDKSVRPLRQELEPQFLETGAVYVMRTVGFRQAQHRFFGKTALYVVPRERSLEIDDPIDLKIAEIVLRERIRNQPAELIPWPLEGIAFDFDGVFTDNRVIVTEEGVEAVCCSRSDGWGITMLQSMRIPLLVLSTEENPVVRARCAKLGIRCIQGRTDKMSALKEWAVSQGITLSKVIYVGNDLNDLECLQAVGCGVVVADAHPDVLSSAKIVLDSRGGHGAIRELADLVKEKLEKARKEGG